MSFPGHFSGVHPGNGRSSNSGSDEKALPIQRRQAREVARGSDGKLTVRHVAPRIDPGTVIAISPES
jgi:hypothetical protein